MTFKQVPCFRLWLYPPQVSHSMSYLGNWCKQSSPWGLWQRIPQRNTMYHSLMLRHWSGKLACSLAQCGREVIMSVTSICKGASCGKSQGIMLSHWVLWAFRGILLSWKPSARFVVRSQITDSTKLGKTDDIYSYTSNEKFFKFFFLVLFFQLLRCLHTKGEFRNWHYFFSSHIISLGMFPYL